jgi:hypothetical protein
MKNIELAEEIKRWFLKNKTNTSRWSDNLVGKTIKNQLIATGNWKNAERGNPKRGFSVMLSNKNK